MAKMHADDLDVDEALVRALLAEQFPQWAELPLVRAGEGTVNVIYRLGDALSVRLPRQEGEDNDVEERILPVLAARLPVAIPQPVGRGRPGYGYPRHWSIHTWLDGELPEGSLPLDDVAGFVEALQQIDPSGGPEPAGGRGKPLAFRDHYVRDALERLEAPGALDLWQGALRAPVWEGPRVWIHADLDRRNVLVREGRLVGVLDWAGAGVGDRAVDLMVAWKLLDPAERELFREWFSVDDATWLRAQGWVLSQALIALNYYTPETNAVLHAEATRWLAEVLG